MGEKEREWSSEKERQFCKVSHYAAVGERKLWLGFQYLRCAKGATEREREWNSMCEGERS